MMETDDTKLRMACLTLAAQDLARSTWADHRKVIERAEIYYQWVAKGPLPEDKEERE